ncbi:MAG: cache domain-containing protein, partial [Oscillospiraceae bacterium]
MKSITAKILTFIGGLVAIAMVLVAIITNIFVTKVVTNDQNYIMQDGNTKTVLYIENYFVKYINIVQQMSRDKNIIKILSSDINFDNYIESPNYNDTYSILGSTTDSDSQNISMAYIAKLGTNVAFDGKGWTGGREYNLTEKDYWISDSNNIAKGFQISEPYKDANTGEMVSTVSTVVYDENGSNIVGVAAIDIKVSTICDMVINTESLYETGYQTLISKEGYVLAHKNPENILKKYTEIGFDSNMTGELENSSGQVFDFVDTEGKSYSVVDTEKNSGWKVANIVPFDEYNESTNSIMRTLVIINVVSIIAIILVILFITKNISKPLRKLTGIIDQLTGGD